MKAFMMLLFYFFVLAAGSAPTVKLRIERPGFTYFEPQAQQIIEERLRVIKLEDIYAPGTSWRFWATNLKVTGFNPPNLDFAISPSGKLMWTSSGGGMLEIQGRWKFYFYTGIKTFHGANAWIVKIFKYLFLSAVRERITALYPQLLQEVVDRMNQQLLALPLRLPMSNNITLEYSFDELPRADSEYLQFEFAAEVVHNKFACQIEPGEILEVDGKGHQLNFWISDQVLDCWLASIYASKLIFFDFLITKDQEPQYLKTDNCTHENTCIGEFFPGLQQLVPHDYLDMRMYSSKAPSVVLAKGSSILHGFFNLDFHRRPYQDHPKPLIRLAMTTSSTINPLIRGSRVAARLIMSTVRLEGISSVVGDITKDFLLPFEGILNQLTGNSTIEEAVNATLWNGVALPTFLGLTFASSTSEIVADQDVLRFNTNFEYQMKNEKTKMEQKTKTNKRKSRKYKPRSLFEVLFVSFP